MIILCPMLPQVLLFTDYLLQGVYCTAHPAAVCLHHSACAVNAAGAASAVSKPKPKRNRNSLDVGYDKKSLHQVCIFHRTSKCLPFLFSVPLSIFTCLTHSS